MSAHAPATRRLRRVIRIGARRAAARAAEVAAPVAMMPLSGASAARFADERDARWRPVEPGLEVFEEENEVGDEEGLAFVLLVLEEEFIAAGRSYPAAAARDARRKLADAPDESDVPDGFHPALWPHIRRIENRIAASNARSLEHLATSRDGEGTL